jgi:glyoxylase-like metal-dependent hydrolase (beta-lactamase superfamily II)
MLRWTLRIVAALFVLALFALALRVGPAHLQIRRVAPRLPSVGELRGLLGAPNGPKSLRWVLTSSQPLARGELAHSVFVAEWPDGSLFEVDAGMDAAAALEFGELLETMAGGGPVTPGGTVPERIGAEAVARIRGLGFTHLHIDHTQGVQALCAAGPAPGARVFQSRAQAELRDVNTEEGGALVASSCFEKARAGEDGLLTLGEFPGLALIPLGGHTACSTMFAFAVDGHLWLLSGDITNSRADLLENRGKGFVYSGLLVPEDTRRTAELRQYLAALDAEPDITVVVSHDLPALRASGLLEWAPEPAQPPEPPADVAGPTGELALLVE